MNKYVFGDIILTNLPYVDIKGSKLRPNLVLFQDKRNVIISKISSKKSTSGILLNRYDGVKIESIIKLDTIFTIDCKDIERKLFELNSSKKKEVCDGIKTKFPFCFNA